MKRSILAALTLLVLAAAVVPVAQASSCPNSPSPVFCPNGDGR